MNKLCIGFLCIIIVVWCCSCGFFGDQRYYCETEEVESVQIIRLDEYVEGEYRFEYTVLTEISDHSEFVDQLNSLDHSVNWGDPTMMHTQDIVVKICYKNGDFDLIHSRAQCFNRSGVNQYGYFFFDKEQFDSIISEWTIVYESVS